LEATLVLEVTEVADRINPNGSPERKSDLNGVSEKEAPVSKTNGSVEAGSKFGWRVGTESEVVAAVSSTVVEATTVVVATEVADGMGDWVSPIRESNR